MVPPYRTAKAKKADYIKVKIARHGGIAVSS